MYKNINILEVREELCMIIYFFVFFKQPTVVVGCPGRIKDLIYSGALTVDKLKIFILDECDTSLGNQRMRYNN